MIYLLTGPVGGGKTTYLKEVVQTLSSSELSVDGFLNVRLLEDEGTMGYDLYDLKLGASIPFLRKQGEADWDRTGDYFFLPQGLETAFRIVARCKRSDLLVIDEIGPLELKGRGLWPALEPVLTKKDRHFLLVVRERILAELLAQLPGQETMIFQVDDDPSAAGPARAILKNSVAGNRSTGKPCKDSD